MRTIEKSTIFKRDFKREWKGRYRGTLETDFLAIINDLAMDVPLAERYRDHELSGNWAGYRDCHIKPDLVLIYRRPDPKTLRLARLGSHSEVFG